MAEENNRKQLIGQVLESKMQKTAVVRIDIRKPHPVYKKYVTQSKKYYVHDPRQISTVFKPLEPTSTCFQMSVLDGAPPEVIAIS